MMTVTNASTSPVEPPSALRPPIQPSAFSLLAISFLLCLTPLVSRALTEGPYTYSTNALGQATITGFNSDYSGPLSVANTLGGCPVTDIGSYAFQSCTALTEVTIPDNVTGIGYGAFNDCSGLTNAVIGNGVTSFDWNMFRGCTGLSSVSIGNGVTSLQGSLKWEDECPFLTRVTLGSGMDRWGLGDLSTCRSLTTLNVSALNPFCSSLNGVLFDKNRQTLILFPRGKGGFYALPTSVIDIPKEAFRDCSSLTNVVIGNGVTLFHWDMFRGCTGLSSVTLGNGITYLQGSPIWEEDCPSLTSVTLGSGIDQGGLGDLPKCRTLTTLNMSGLNPFFSSLNGVLFDKNRQTLLRYPSGKTGSYAIPASVTAIGESAFSFCTNLTSITVPDSVTRIEAFAFYACAGLTHAVIGSGVNSIGDVAFQNCTGLTNVLFKGNAPSAGADVFSTVDNAVVYYLQGAAGWKEGFNGWPAVLLVQFAYAINSDMTVTITEYLGTGGAVVIPSTLEDLPVTGVAFGAFFDCPGLTAVTLPEGVTSIGDGAFWKCTGLTSVAIPSTVTEIGWRAFSECGSLSDVFFWGDVPSADLDVFYQADNATVHYLQKSSGWGKEFGGRPASVIPFDYMINPDNTVTIQHYTGGGGAVIIPSALEGRAVTAIDYKTFSYRNDLSSVTIPDSVTSIGDYAFQYCSGLTNAVIGNGVISIGKSAFDGCSSLAGVTLPEVLASIGERAFADCTGLTGVTLPAGLASTGDRAFAGCTGLTGITLPEGLASIGNAAFANCAGLTGVTIPSSVDVIGNEAFENCTGLTGITIPEGVVSIGDWAFTGCTSLTNASIPSSVTHIGFVFDTCLALRRVTLLNDLSTFQAGMVFGHALALLTDVIVGDNVIAIGDNAFRGSCGLTNVVIGTGVNTIGDYAFAGCTGLTSITIPNSVTSIGYRAFSECANLICVVFDGNAPTLVDNDVFYNTPATIYYFPGTTGWGSTFAGRPTALWIPRALYDDAFGFQGGPFGFNISWASGRAIIVEASTNLTSGVWTPLTNATLGTSGSLSFTDPSSSTHPERFYRIVWP